MYYRRKIPLALLQHFDNGLDKLKLQKLMFLFAHGHAEMPYEFVPYKFGCFSFTLNADMSALSKTGYAEEDGKKWLKSSRLDYFLQLKASDQKRLQAILHLYGQKSADELIDLTYNKYPYFAINSTIAYTRLSQEQYDKVQAARPINIDFCLFTIGYEGLSLEAYLNKLIRHDVNVLFDVRRNPLSMKYGFHKSQLQGACEGVGIRYRHLPELGIESGQRQQLNSQQDYDELFQVYRKTCLPLTKAAQQTILETLTSSHRVALTCFEADIHQCHRKHLAEAISQLDGFSYKLQHI
jgi:uncharacterized protein (DUF488 family)